MKADRWLLREMAQWPPHCRRRSIPPGAREPRYRKQGKKLEAMPGAGAAALPSARAAASRRDRAADAIAHLRRALEINERVKELVETDEDLDALRDDPGSSSS